MCSIGLTIFLSGNDNIQKRLHHQKTDANLALVLIFTILMFFMFHSPRVILSVYEAITIQNVLTCSEKQKGFYTIWYLYVQNTLQFVQVYLFCCSNSYIYYIRLFDQSSSVSVSTFSSVNSLLVGLSIGLLVWPSASLLVRSLV
jgi:hypothetical protein